MATDTAQVSTNTDDEHQIAMCEQCGLTRTVSARFSLSVGRQLRCEHCRSSTRHQGINPDNDFRESINAKDATEWARAAQQVEHMLAMFDRLGVAVERHPVTGYESLDNPAAEVYRERGRDWVREWVIVAPEVTDRELPPLLRWAWGHLLDSDDAEMAWYPHPRHPGILCHGYGRNRDPRNLT